MNSFFRRLKGIRFIPALLLCLPGIALCLWYSTSAWLTFKRYSFATDETPPLTTEIFHLHLHDTLNNDLRWMTAPRYAAGNRLDEITLDIPKSRMPRFLASVGQQEDRPWLEARLRIDGVTHDVEIRARGRRHSHYVTKKKSFRVRIREGGDLIRGLRTFNLTNETEPLLVGQKLITDIAAQNNVVVPQYDFVRLSINGEDMGIYHFQAHPDQHLFRRHHLMPGTLFTSDPGDDKDVLAMWRDPDRWSTMVEYREGGEIGTAQLPVFLDQLLNGSFESFAAYATRHIDMKAFADFEAIDVVFGIEQHGFRDRHRLLYDPYKGRWRPVASSLKGFKHDGVFNRAENPITLRLKMIPEYRLLRDQAVYELLTNDCSVPQIRRHMARLIQGIQSDVKSDRLLFADKILPKASNYLFRMLRPLDLDTVVLSADNDILQFRRRYTYLMNQLKRNPLSIHVFPTRENPPSTTETPEIDESRKFEQKTTNGYTTDFVLLLQRTPGADITRFSIIWDETCATPNFEVRDSEGTVITDASGYVQTKGTSPGLRLFTGATITERTRGDRDRHNLQMSYEPTAYPFALTSSCRPKGIRARGLHLVTGSSITSLTADPDLLVAQRQSHPEPSAVPALQVDQSAPRPTMATEQPREKVTMGPGIVEVPSTLRFQPRQQVIVQPGTTLRMGKDASLFFEGRVHFRGTRGAPIVIEAAGKKPWGGIAILGRAASGSTLTNVVASGGTVPGGSTELYPGMINFHDVQRITVSNSRFFDNQIREAMIQGAYVKKLEMRDVIIENAADDGLDLEFSTADISGLRVLNPRDEAIDLMHTELRLRQSLIQNARNNGISVGQESRLYCEDVAIVQGRTGILAKDASVVDLRSTLLYRNRIGLNIVDSSSHYEGDVTIQADLLYVVGVKTPGQRKGRRRRILDDGYIRYGFSDYRTLRLLFQETLRIREPAELETLFPAEVSR